MTDYPHPPFQGSAPPTLEELEALTTRVYKPPHVFYHPTFGLIRSPGTPDKINIEDETLEQFRARKAAQKP